MNYLKLKDDILLLISKDETGIILRNIDIINNLNAPEFHYLQATQLLQTDGFINPNNDGIWLTPNGREFISHTSYQKEYDKKQAKEKYAKNANIFSIVSLIISAIALIISIFKK